MDFQISKQGFNAVCRQILQGRAADSPDLVDMTAALDLLSVVVTGRSVEVPIEILERGSFSIPISVLFKMKKIGGTYVEKTFRIRVKEGSFRLQGMSVSHSGITAKEIAGRVIDMPDDAAARDVLSLPLIFTVEEIDEYGWSAKLLDKQKELADRLTSAATTLRDYDVNRNELDALVARNLKAHSETLRRVLFEPKAPSELRLDKSSDGELERRKKRMERCKFATERGDRYAFMYAEWADTSQLEFSIWWERICFPMKCLNATAEHSLARS
jgi:hypothetical protein